MPTLMPPSAQRNPQKRRLPPSQVYRQTGKKFNEGIEGPATYRPGVDWRGQSPEWLQQARAAKVAAEQQSQQTILEGQMGRSLASGMPFKSTSLTPEIAAGIAKARGYPDMPPSLWAEYLPPAARKERAAGRLPENLMPTAAVRSPTGEVTTTFGVPPRTPIRNVPPGLAPSEYEFDPTTGKAKETYKPQPEKKEPYRVSEKDIIEINIDGVNTRGYLDANREFVPVGETPSPIPPKLTKADIDFYTERGFDQEEAKSLRDAFLGVKGMPQTPKEISMELSRWQTILNKTREVGPLGQFGKIFDQETFDLATKSIEELRSQLDQVATMATSDSLIPPEATAGLPVSQMQESIFAVNKKTGQRLVSNDGGKTWQQAH